MDVLIVGLEIRNVAICIALGLSGLGLGILIVIGLAKLLIG